MTLELPENRGDYPILTGLLDYFPNACAEVANCSKAANDQHNPGEPMHWAPEKSIGDGNQLLRHLMQRGTRDTDGVRHSAKMAWRALELLERELAAERNKANELVSLGGGSGNSVRAGRVDMVARSQPLTADNVSPELAR